MTRTLRRASLRRASLHLAKILIALLDGLVDRLQERAFLRLRVEGNEDGPVGRTGEQLHRETFREEILYNANQQTPALSSYFELMDRLLPTFLNTLSAQKIRGTRVLLKD